MGAARCGDRCSPLAAAAIIAARRNRMAVFLRGAAMCLSGEGNARVREANKPQRPAGRVFFL